MQHPVLFCAPPVLQDSARTFLDGFPGLVSYAVKANPDPLVLSRFAAAGITTFDVASPREMEIARAAVPGAVLHYNNPVRSPDEIAAAQAHGVASWAVDSTGELDKLACALPPGTEVSVRLKLPVAGAAYDFGSKFGAGPDMAARLLAGVAAAGLTPALTFHPGTQCDAPRAWADYIAESAAVARRAGVRLARLNVGGGFPARRSSSAPDLAAIFARIAAATRAAFGPQAPALVCEPGRALVAEGMTLAARVKALRDDAALFLNDGIYGALAELPVMGVPDRIEARAPDGTRRQGPPRPRTVFGPTCDSLDRLPGTVALPADLAEGDYLLFHGLGAYSSAIATPFNGYGVPRRVQVAGLQAA